MLERESGYIISWFPEKHWGFVSSSVYGQNAFLHVSQLFKGDVENIQVGCTVEYTPITNERGIAAREAVIVYQRDSD
jgi:cold shock CspA family protein